MPRPVPTTRSRRTYRRVAAAAAVAVVALTGCTGNSAVSSDPDSPNTPGATATSGATDPLAGRYADLYLRTQQVTDALEANAAWAGIATASDFNSYARGATIGDGWPYKMTSFGQVGDDSVFSYCVRDTDEDLYFAAAIAESEQGRTYFLGFGPGKDCLANLQAPVGVIVDGTDGFTPAGDDALTVAVATQLQRDLTVTNSTAAQTSSEVLAQDTTRRIGTALDAEAGALPTAVNAAWVDEQDLWVSSSLSVRYTHPSPQAEPYALCVVHKATGAWAAWAPATLDEDPVAGSVLASGTNNATCRA